MWLPEGNEKRSCAGILNRSEERWGLQSTLLDD